MYHAIKDIKQGEVICFTENDVYPLRTQSDFIAASGFMSNASKDYSTGDPIEANTPNLINQEKDNISKLNQAKIKATGPARVAISKVIAQKMTGLFKLI